MIKLYVNLLSNVKYFLQSMDKCQRCKGNKNAKNKVQYETNLKKEINQQNNYKNSTSQNLKNSKNIILPCYKSI